ncbi:protein of unknown function [Algoriphagus faecimaris]|uniref:DUF4221 domain-containing protein n=2 Tax=Algoriphagus faecimaris TaxID=686796 RepID=A0A1G6QMD7_9BACT|nr:DUF4221 family protein [Algoriphagus faecimaris]SDC92886.1 protein of unknown function [Algoriphagus faecimaris]
MFNFREWNSFYVLRMKKYLPILAVFLLFNCKSEPKKNRIIKSNVFKSIEIPINEDFAPKKIRTQYFFSDSGQYLAIQNKVNFEIGIFNLDSKKLAHIIPLQKQGPNGVGLNNGFEILSQDCVLIASIPPRIHFLNFAGNKKSSLAIDDPENKANYLAATNETPLLFSENSLYGIQPYFQDLYRTSESDLKKSKPIFKLNFGGKIAKLNWLSIFRPEDEWEEGKKSPDVSWAHNGDTIIVSPQLDHKFWIVSKSQEKVIGYKTAKSNKINGFRIIEGYPNGDEEIIKDLKNGRYEALLYDSYRKVFYRFFYSEIDWENYNLTPRQLLQNHSKVGVLVLNQDLEIMGEHHFGTNYVQTWNYFVGKKGLYISTNNPNRDDFDENFLKYDIIRFEGLNYED